MENIKERERAERRFFNKTIGISEDGFENYLEGAKSALSEIAGYYGIARLECRFCAPDSLFLPDDIPHSFAVYDDGTCQETSSMFFSYPFERDCNIEYYVHVIKGTRFVDRMITTIETMLRQLYFTFDVLLRNISRVHTELIDTVTGIPNLKAFMQFSEELINKGITENYTGVFFNIRNFRSIIKSLTYIECDSVLETYCRFISQAITEDEFVARLGGDNLVAYILDENRDYFFDLIQNMVVKYEKEGHTLVFMLGATIGAAKLKQVSTTEDIMMQLSTAYQIARDRKRLLSYYDHDTSLELMEQKIILAKFFNAILKREFFAVYQPKVSAVNHEIIGAEALVRWKHDDGYIMPGSFIPVLEKDGCITALDFYMLEEACRLLSRLKEEGFDPIKISVNFSKRHLANNKLVEEIVEIIDKYLVPHSSIVVELTESEDYHNHGVMRDIVDELNALGIKTSIDDFGTGYSSLGMLRTLQLDELKIDRSFIPGDGTDSADKNLLMLQGVVTLAKNLGLTIVAEGVETFEQLDLVEKMGCDMIQGYVFDKPLPESEFVERMKHKKYIIDNR